MSFFRNIRSSLSSSSRAKSSRSSSRDTTPVRSVSRPGSVISSLSHRRDSTTSSTLQRGDTFILPNSEEEEAAATGPASNTSTLEKKSKKSKVFSKFSTFTKRKKTPSPEEVASYEHHPSDTATNTYYKWRSDGADRLQDYDAQSDPFNFLYEQHSSLRNLQSADNGGVHRQASIGSNSSGSFDSSTYRKSKTPTHLREQLEQLKTHSNDDLLEDQQREDDEREKYKTVTLNSFRKSFRDRLLQQQKETPHNPAWFVEVPAAQQSTAKTLERRESKENRPDFLVFDNENYRPQSRSPLRDRPSRSATRSPVKRNETFRVAQPSMRHLSPSLTPDLVPPAPSIRIEIKNSISPHSPGRFVPVGVAKPMPTTEYYAQRLLAANHHHQQQHHQHQHHQQQHHQQQHHQQQRAGLGVRSSSPIQSSRWYRQQPSPNRLGHQMQNPPQQKGGRTLVHIGSEQNKAMMPPPARGRAPTRVQLYGNKPQSRPPPTTYFGGHFNAPAKSAVAPRGSSVGGHTVYLGRRDPPMTRATNSTSTSSAAHVAAPMPRRNRSPIKMPWR